MRQTLCEDLDEMENLGIIKTSNSPNVSPVAVVEKKDDSNRICIDYKQLNKLTVFNPHPMIPPADVFQGMGNSRYFSKINLNKGCWQIPVRQQDIPKTVFVTMDCHHEFLRMPFAMMNSRAILTLSVKMILRGMEYVVEYVDDLLVHTPTWEDYVNTLRELFKRLQRANFTVRPSVLYLLYNYITLSFLVS
ncbi:Zinc finger protein [Plakobranchus ocellatus]|uniref:Zinc finger protein n=1 Tax=Plakobranchus ocellatus TaxID=259542 RepID=A0AAV4AZ07_9GAST|nr:Zinc finger protein [Plakobranchus ocellatus]